MTHHYLIRYGRPGFVGRFASTLALTRGDRVVMRSPRGVEFGEVLVASERFNAPDEGDILRAVAPDDDADSSLLDARAKELLALADTRCGELGLPLTFVDVEVTLDRVAILHALAWDACDATAFLDELGAHSGLVVRLLDLSRAPIARDPTGGCGKPGCGSESGGCSTCGTSGGCSSGSCSRGSVKSAEELTAYFAGLRHQMEAAGFARTPLN